VAHAQVQNDQEQGKGRKAGNRKGRIDLKGILDIRAKNSSHLEAREIRGGILCLKARLSTLHGTWGYRPKTPLLCAITKNEAGVG